jgi:galactosamine-6-phosphate isomerase
MNIRIYKDYEAMSEAAATELLETIKQKPTTSVCFASGHTPLLTYKLFVDKIESEGIDVTRAHFFGLDEWVGVPPENEGSCHYFLYNIIFKPLKLQENQIHVFNAMAGDLTAACKSMDAAIEEKGGIDLMIVGIGMNGHIGFNEPGTSINALCHVATLDNTTQSVGQKYFNKEMILNKGITIGLGHLLKAKKVFLQANGSKKAMVIKQTVEGELNENLPASIMQQHANGFAFLDEGAASLLKRQDG